MDLLISRLICFGLKHEMIQKEDVDYSVNLLLDVLQLDDYKPVMVEEDLSVATEILDGMLEYAVEKGIIEDSITAKDLFDTRIMNCIMPRPSEVVKKFNELYNNNSQDATHYFYDLSIASNYIRKSRTDKNIGFKRYHKYGYIEITINLSKPEKDPKEIAKARLVKSSSYPTCLLCKENVGFAGHFNHPARQTHRIIPLDLNGENYYMQYSPYVYYNEHCIIFNEEHKPMKIDRNTFEHLLTFVEKFPHYMLGSNADLPIVGGSILTHDHFQGGRYTFPIENAEVIKEVKLDKYPSLKLEIIKWPLSTLRVSSVSKEEVLDFAELLLEKWISYSNESLDIIAFSDDVRHNTITPIARMKDGVYSMDLVLRNNRTSEKYPDGIFHPHPHLHHIKKENIGLIEVMGLAILPARLKTEIELLKQCLLKEKHIDDYEELHKHKLWAEELSLKPITKETVDDIVEASLTAKFVEVLENAGVFKMNEEGIDSFVRFVENIDKEGK